MRVVRTSVLFLLLVIGAGCSRPMLSGMFVERDNPREVDMLRLVESPPGRLSGSLVVSSLDQDGTRKQDTVYNVVGSISGSNVSLRPVGGLMSFAHWLGAPTNFVGSISGGVLTLSVGNDTLVFHEMPQQEYESALDRLDKVGHHIAIVVRSNRAMQEVKSDNRRLNAGLQNYIKWGKSRVNHAHNVRHWYTDRIAHYAKCLRIIRPMAVAQVPSWRWQGCVLAIENDKYSRDQEVSDFRRIYSENQRTVKRLNAGIAGAPQQLSKALDLMKSACPFMKDVASCEAKVKNLQSLLPDGFLDHKTIIAYRTMVPRVQKALDADAQTKSRGEKQLAVIARQVTNLYRSASSN